MLVACLFARLDHAHGVRHLLQGLGFRVWFEGFAKLGLGLGCSVQGLGLRVESVFTSSSRLHHAHRDLHLLTETT